jgi:hypothetical protein
MKQGQLAHLNRDPSDSSADNLAFLCLEHHDWFDTRTSQSKGPTIEEAKHYREKLYNELKRRDEADDHENGRKHEWARLTNADRATLSLRLQDGNCYKVEIYTSPARDCVLLGEDFYRFFQQMRWNVSRREMALAIAAPPGIQILTVPYTEPGGVIKNIKERSGAVLMVEGLRHIGLPVIYGTRGGYQDDLTVHMTIGVRPDPT